MRSAKEILTERGTRTEVILLHTKARFASGGEKRYFSMALPTGIADSVASAFVLQMSSSFPGLCPNAAAA